MRYLSEHLHSIEIRCKCGCGLCETGDEFSKSTVIAFEKIRENVSEYIGEETPIKITSGCRCWEYHKNLYEKKGQRPTKLSRHLYCDALDIAKPAKIDYQTFYQICLDVIGETGGVGYYPDKKFVHIDTRGNKARWP